MGLLIQNGSVVTAEKTLVADVLIEGETIKDVRAGIDAVGHTVVDAKGMLVLPGGIDAHTHLDMPFGGTTSADDFETGTRAAAIGGTTTIVDFAIQAKGTKMRSALDTWWKKAAGKACIDYGLHMIVTDLGTSGLEDMDDLVREGVASFKLFMAYPGVLMVDDATIFKALQRTSKNGALICMHAENGSVIDVIVQQALAGEDRSDLSRVDAPDHRRSRGCAAGDCDGGDGRGTRVHRASFERGRAESGAGGAGSGPAGVCGDLSAILVAVARRDDEAQLVRGREVGVHSATAREEESAKAVGWVERRSSAGGFDRSLSVLL